MAFSKQRDLMSVTFNLLHNSVDVTWRVVVTEDGVKVGSSRPVRQYTATDNAGMDTDLNPTMASRIRTMMGW